MIGDKIDVDLASCIEAEKAPHPQQQEEKPSYESKSPQRHENREDIQYQLEQEEQEEQETKPQNDNIVTKTLQVGEKLFQSFGNVFTSIFQG